MELEELIENTLRRKHLEEMMGRPEKEHTPLEGMDNEQIKRFALFLFEENQNKSKQLDEMKAERPYRKGMRYNKECVGTPIIHKSDYTMLPKGSVVISSSYRKIRNIVSYIEEHHFEVLKVKHADGRIESMFLPMKDDARADIYNEIVPGTSITANMLSYLMFNRFQMSTPAYREAKNRLSDMDWNTSPQNLLNWAEKGAMQLNKLIPALKKIALQDGANTPSFYMYLDNELMDIEHLCCLAHARAKFKYAYDQGSLQVRIFLELIAFSPPANPDESRSELMSKALNYLKTFWNQIFAYRNDGEYSIDNLPAERALRPVTVQRKNSLFFGSVKGIQNSAIYNTFIETCKQVGVSFRDYFCKLLRELKKGRTDYENLLPMTICK